MNETSSNVATTMPSSLRERRKAIARKKDSAQTLATTISSCDTSYCTESSLPRDHIAENYGQPPVGRIYRQASAGPSLNSSSLTLPPRLSRESSSESSGSAARKRSIGGTHKLHYDYEKQNCRDDSDLELIRQQHEIMEQIQQEQEAFIRVNEQYECSASLKNTPSGKEYHFPSLPPRWSPMRTTPTRPDKPVLSSTRPPTDNENILDMYIDDPSIIHEQQRIMDEILRQQRPKDAPSRHDHVLSPSRSAIAAAAIAKRAALAVTVTSEGNSTQGFRQCQSRSMHVPASTVARHPEAPLPFASVKLPAVEYSANNRSSKNTRQNTNNDHDDVLVTLHGQKKSLRIKGTRHTWKAIEEGRATLVQCLNCLTILQIGRMAEFVFCTKCEEVSPIVQVDGKSTSDDGQIARVMQQQENDVALTRKVGRR